MKDFRSKNKRQDNDAIPRYKHIPQPAQPRPMRRNPESIHLNYQQQQLWQLDFQIQNENPFSLFRISAFGPLLIHENNYFTNENNSTLYGDVGNGTSQRRKKFKILEPGNTQTINNLTTIPTRASQLTLYKKSTATESRLNEEKFNRVPDQCIDLSFHDFHICTNNHSLTNQGR